MSTLDGIRARDEHGQGGDTLQAADRRTLLALLDAQSLELAAIESSNQCLRTAIAGDDQMLDALRAELSAQSLELQAVREALGNLLWAAEERDKRNRIRQFDEFVDAARAALKQSRGAT